MTFPMTGARLIDLRGLRRPLSLFAVLACGFLAGLPGPSAAREADPVQQHNSNALWFENWLGLRNATLVIAAPNGTVTEIFAASGTPVFELARDTVLDGTYRYELKAATDTLEEIANPLDNGRGEAAGTKAKPFYMSGSFVVSRGVIITPETLTED